MAKRTAKNVKAESAKRKAQKQTVEELTFLSTGCTLLNLALSDRWDGGYCTGTLVNPIGDSSAGKTLCALTTLAEACVDSYFDDYQLIYDDTENRNTFDLQGMFGSLMSDRVEAPRYDGKDTPVYSRNVQEFTMNLDRALGRGPCIYVLDSFDGIGSIEEEEYTEKAFKALEQDKDIDGTYGMSKPKWFSKVMGGGMMHKIKDTGSIVIIISQTRDDINPRTMSTKTRSGGRALKFYSHHEYWLAVAGAWDKTVRAKKRKIGSFVQCKVSKNSVTGKQRQINFPVSYSYGVDDIRANIDFLILEGVWTGTKEKVTAKELDFSGSKNQLVEYVEDNNLEQELAELVEDTWLDIEEALKSTRKKRYE